MKRTLAVLSLIAMGCGTSDDEPIERVFDPCATVLVPAPDVHAEERASIQSAADLWHMAADTRLTIDPDSQGEAALRLEVRFDAAAAAFRGLYDDRRGIVFVNRNIADPHARTIVLAHELGHSFGLLHVAPDERISLMNPENLEVPPTAADASLLQSAWGRCGERSPP